MLPDRSTDAEDAFVAGMSDADAETLAAAVTEAIAATRPRLAARLVGLIDVDVPAAEGTPLDRARKAAALLLLPRGRVEEDFDRLQLAWAEFRRRRVDRLKQRARESLGAPPRHGPKRPGRSR